MWSYSNMEFRLSSISETACEWDTGRHGAWNHKVSWDFSYLLVNVERLLKIWMVAITWDVSLTKPQSASCSLFACWVCNTIFLSALGIKPGSLLKRISQNVPLHCYRPQEHMLSLYSGRSKLLQRDDEVE